MMLSSLILILFASMALAHLYVIFGSVHFPWLAPMLVHLILGILGFLGLAHKHQWFRHLSPIKTSSTASMQKSQELLTRFPYLPATILILVCFSVAMLTGMFNGSGPALHAIGKEYWIYICVIPFVEELFFRRVCGVWLRARHGFFWGAYLSSFFFALVHATPTWSRISTGDVGVPLGPFVLGIACECLLACTAKLWPAVALHMAANATVVVFVMFDERWLRWLGWFYL